MWTIISEQPKAAVFSDGRDCLRIGAVNRGCFRITQTREKGFILRNEPMIVRAQSEAAFSVSEEKVVYRIQTDALYITLDCQRGFLSYYDGSGRLLTSEPAACGRTLTRTDIVRYRYDVDAETTQHQSVDGAKMTAEGTPYTDREGFSARLSLRVAEDEVLYGLGQHEERVLNHRYDDQYLYQHNWKISIPVLVSSNGWGVFLNTGSYVAYHGDRDGCTFVVDAADELDYFVFYGGNLDGCVAVMRSLTGDAPLPPQWAFGYLQCKERYKTQQELIDIATEYRRRNVPLDAVVQDWFSWPEGLWGQKSVDTARYPDLKAATDTLHGMHCHLMWSIWPNMTGNGADRLAFEKLGLLLGNRSTYNAFSADARALYWKQADDGLYSQGVDAWWCDCSEPFEADWHGEEEPSGAERMRMNVSEAKRYIDPTLINTYSVYHAQGVYEGQRGTDAGKRVLILTRSGYPGQQRYGTFVWNGDTSASWKALRDWIPNALNLCVTGIPYWTQDVGAFFVKRWKQWFGRGEYENGVQDEAYRELYLRWFQASTFLPMLRAHGTDTPREVWQFGTSGDEYYDGIVEMIKLRMRLLPYLYSLAADITFRRGTMLRMLAFDFSYDPTAREIMDEFLLGRALLVCPVLTEGARSRMVYLPAGVGWFSFATGAFFRGGQWIKADAPLQEIPLYVRAGSILPLGPVKQYTAEVNGQPLILRIYSGADADFSLYNDAGNGYRYEHQDYGWLHLHWDNRKHSLTQTVEGDPRYIAGNPLIEVIEYPSSAEERIV
ncbi:MAG: DUF5110 domain-containing protein [Clostridiales bacterium]|nr:DUF5110 domain-containing protein [Clostridiales bacterium]